MIEADVYQHLTDWPATAAIVGTRVYPIALPQGVTFPALTFQRVSGGEAVTHSGIGPAQARMQIDSWATTHDGALALAATVRAAFASHRGPLGAQRYATARIINAIDLPEPEIDRWRRVIEVLIDYEEAA